MDTLLFAVAQVIIVAIAIGASLLTMSSKDENAFTLILGLVEIGALLAVMQLSLLHYGYGIDLFGWWS